MKNYKKDLLERIIDLYYMYDRYLSKNKDSKLDILIQDNSIGFYLYSDNDDIDNLVLTFDNGENSLYKYISASILLEMIRNVVVTYNNHEFYNNAVKPHLKLVVNDRDILVLLIDLVDEQFEWNKDSLVKSIENRVINPFFYPKNMINKLDERMNVTKRILRYGGVV